MNKNKEEFKKMWNLWKCNLIRMRNLKPYMNLGVAECVPTRCNNVHQYGLGYIDQGSFYLTGSALPFFHLRNPGVSLMHPWFVDWVLNSWRSSKMGTLQSTCTCWCKEEIIKLLSLSFNSDSRLLGCYPCFC